MFALGWAQITQILLRLFLDFLNVVEAICLYMYLGKNHSPHHSNAKAAATAGLSVNEDSDALREHLRDQRFFAS